MAGIGRASATVQLTETVSPASTSSTSRLGLSVITGGAINE